MTLTTMQLSLRNQDGLNGLSHIHEVEESQSPTTLDSSLTSLGWLQHLRVPDLYSSEVSLPSPCSEDGFSWETVSSSSPEERKGGTEAGISLSPIRKCLLQSTQFRSAPRKYRSNATKPPFSYTTLVYLAIQHSKSQKVTLNKIYTWIRENFKYYRTADLTWQNSIRHNLSLNKMFVKVPHVSGNGGKGCCWKISPDYEHILSDENKSCLLGHNFSKLQLSVNGKSRKRAHSQSCYGTGSSRKTSIPRKRIKSSTNAPADPCGLPGDLNWVSLLSSQSVGCRSCPSQSCRPAFGSPVLSPPDLGHIGEPVMCSPLIIPTSLSSEQADLPETPLVQVGENKGALLEEAVLKQDSPSPQLLPWAESRLQSPSLAQPHPWAESRETTLHEMKNLYTSRYSRNSIWSPESSWSSTGSTNSISTSYSKRTPLLSETCIY